MKTVTVRELGQITDYMVTNDSYSVVSKWVGDNFTEATVKLIESADVEEIEWDLGTTVNFEDVSVNISIIYYLGRWYLTYFSSGEELFDEELRVELEFKFYGKNKIFVETK